MRPWSLLRISLLLAVLSASCGDSATGTYVRLNFSTSVSMQVPIDRIAVDLQMGAETASTVFQAPDQTGIKLPTDAILDIGSGAGLLFVAARALSKDDLLLGTGSKSGTVVRGQTTEIDIVFGAPTPGAGGDAGIDGPGPAEDAGADQAIDAPTGIDTPSVLDGPEGTEGGGVDAPAADAPLPPADAPGADSPAGTGGAPSTDGIIGGRGGTIGGRGGSSGAGGVTGGTGGSPGTGGTSGPPKAYHLTASPPSLDFGVVAPNTSSPPKSITVINDGDAPTPPLVVSISDMRNFIQKLDTRACGNAVLNPGDTCTVTFVFAPTASGPLQADGSVAPASGAGVKFHLSGSGAGGLATLNLAPPTADLGPVDVGTSASVNFTLSNGGDFDAGTITTQLDAPSTFRLTNNNCAGLLLGPRGQCSFTLTFAPTAFGPASAKVNVQSSTGLAASAAVSAVAQDYVLLTIGFAGKGVGSVAGGPQACPSGNPCTFNVARTDPNRLPKFGLTAEPTPPSVFGGWNGACSGGGACSVLMDGPRSVTATFDLPTATLNLTVLGLAGHGGRLVSDDGAVNCSGSCPGLSVPVSDNFVLRAMPASGSTFAGWTSGPCSWPDPKCAFPTAGTINITATFGPQSYMFVTSSTVIPGALGGLEGADARCSALAANAGLPGTYVAWLSSTTTDASARIGAGGWIRTDGRPFAADLSTLTDASTLAVFYPPRLDEHGKDVVAGQRTPVATATTETGRRLSTTCGDYTSTAGSLLTGDAAGGSTSWTNRTIDTSGCANPQRLYCFRSDLAPGPLAPIPQPGRRIFTTSAPFVLSDGIPPNDVCRKEADAAGVLDSSVFVAFLATTTTPAINLVNLSGRPWKRMDEVFVVEQAADLASGKLLAAIGVTASGRTYTFAAVWTGAQDPGSLGTATCNDWSTLSPSPPIMSGTIGNSGRSSPADWFSGGNAACTSTTTRLMCIEP